MAFQFADGGRGYLATVGVAASVGDVKGNLPFAGDADISLSRLSVQPIPRPDSLPPGLAGLPGLAARRRSGR